MAKKNHKHKSRPHPKFRNATGGGSKMQKLGDTVVEAVERTAASAAGGAAAAMIGGFAVSNDLMDPETIGLITTVGGAALASRSATKWREAFNGAAAAGAGQLVLGYMAKRALKKQKDAPQNNAPSRTPQTAARQGMKDGYVMQMFRDMAGGLDGYVWQGDHYERQRADDSAGYGEPDVVVLPAA